MFDNSSPSDYNEMLVKLNKWSAITTFSYVFVLTYLGYLPVVEMDKRLFSPNAQEWIGLAFSLGVVPAIVSSLAFLLSRGFEIHNFAAKIIGLRRLWDSRYIVKPICERANQTWCNDKDSVRAIMQNVYYKEVKNIDQHFVTLFWRYALYFWALFEHFVFVLAINIAVEFFFTKGYWVGELWIYCLLVGVLGGVHWTFIVAPKSKSQAYQINQEAIDRYFENKEAK